MDFDDQGLEDLVAKVRQGEQYRWIEPELVRRIGRRELKDHRNLREAVKATRSKLHQVGGAYLPGMPPYPQWVAELAHLSGKRDDLELRSFCLNAMRFHSSTRERLPILETFYATLFAALPRIHSLMDLACGLNPLALPWMSLDPTARYLACDIFGDMVTFLGTFFAHLHLDGRAWSCDLSEGFPDETVDLALLLKAIPCLEQLEKTLPMRLMDGIKAKYILVSFPVTSLGGVGKGMRSHYENHFMDLVSERQWAIERFEFRSELAFLVAK